VNPKQFGVSAQAVLDNYAFKADEFSITGSTIVSLLFGQFLFQHRLNTQEVRNNVSIDLFYFIPFKT
jgi:hypothetical protein